MEEGREGEECNETEKYLQAMCAFTAAIILIHVALSRRSYSIHCC